MDARRVIAGVGRTLITGGVLILLFVAYQLWGTGLAEARSQDRLTDDFRAALAAPVTTTTTDPSATEPPPTTAPVPTPAGEAVAIVRIPRIGVEKAVVEGVGVDDLKKGPGHYPSTPLPGQPGNVAVAGHRTTYGGPFFRLDELERGDEILVTTRQGRFRYVVSGRDVVAPNRSDVLAPTDDNRLTLTTCEPRFSARQRLVVVASLATEPAEPAPVPVPVTTQVPDEPPVPPAALEQAGLSGESAPRGPAVMWGALAAWVWLAAWLASRHVGRLVAYGLGVPAFAVALFVFFENFARLLPANV